ncbi:PAS domain S-box protein, partial [Aeromonas salmonicida]|uniref:PAS domain S-box protein n=2 Tax=Aeromonas salmonicida TaxID=645 RepID=UPI00223EC0F6
MKQQATQMMWFYDRQQEQWSLSDHASYQLWQGEGAHPWAGQLAADDEPGFSDFLSRLYHSHQPAQFIGHLNDEEGSVRHVLWSGQYIPAQQVCCGWLAPLDTTRSTPLPAELSQQLPLLQDPLLAQLAQALSARTGLDFFDTLVNQLAHILVADAVWLAERTGSDRLKVLACHGIDLKEYELAGMPCQQVYRRGEACVVTIESHCQLNPQLKAGQRYYAQPLFDRNGQILGHLALLFSGEIEIPNLGSVLTIFSVRMVAELERLQSDAQLRLSAVAFETHEGIIITDPDFKILRVNHAFSQITGFDSQRVIGLHLGNELWSGLDGLG